MKIGKNKHIFKRGVLFLLAICIAVSSIAINTDANAAVNADLSVQDKARAYAYYQATVDCIANGNGKNGMNEGIVASTGSDGKTTDPANGNWFQDDAKSYVPSATGSGISLVACSTIVHKTLNSYFGYADGTYYKLLEAMGYKWSTVVDNQWVKVDADTQKVKDFKAEVAAPTLSAASKYWLYQNAFFSQCSPTPLQGSGNLGDPVSAYSATNQKIVSNTVVPSASSTAGVSTVKVVNNGVLDTYGFKYANPTSNDLKLGGRIGSAIAAVPVYGSRDTTAQPAAVGSMMFCSDLVSGMNNNASDYATALSNLTCNSFGYTSGDAQKACVAGIQHGSTDPAYCQTAYGYSTALLQACIKGSGATLDDAGGAKTTATTDGQSSCVVDGIGWIVCTVSVFVAKASDNLYGLLEQLLSVPPVNTDISNGANGVYNAWSVIRNLANVAFVLIFLIIIFSQLTNIGVTNYGIKKALPRLIIAAVLVNISYWLAAIAVDVSNILGKSIYDLLAGVKAQMNIGGLSNHWASIITTLLAGGTVAAGAGGVLVVTAAVAAAAAPTALLYLAIPLVLGALLAIFMVVFILIARQALVIILILAAPLAFVALLLPNTEKLFTRWRQLFVSLLLMFPIVSIIFGGAQIAGLAIMSSAGNDGVNTGLSIVVGQFVMVAPFFFVPFIITKFSGGNLDNLIKQVASRGQKLIGGAQNTARKAGRKQLGRSFNQAKYGGFDAKYNKNGKESMLSRVRRGTATKAIGSAGKTYDQWQNRKDMTDKVLATESATQTRARLASDPKYLNKVAGGVAGGAERLKAEVEAEALKTATAPLNVEIATWRRAGMNTDNMLVGRAKDTTKSAAERNAAIHALASSGRDDAIRTLKTDTDPFIDQSVVQQAIDANQSALSKSPDLTLGSAKLAFDRDLKGKDIATWTKGTANEYKKYVATLSIDEQAKPVASLNAGLKQIQDNPGLQSDFAGETGTILMGLAAPGIIQANGRIASVAPGAGNTPTPVSNAAPAPSPAGTIIPVNPNSPGPIGSEVLTNIDHSAAPTPTTQSAPAPTVTQSTAAPTQPTQQTTQTPNTSSAAPAQQASPINVDSSAEIHQRTIDAKGGIQNLTDAEVQTIIDSAEKHSILDDGGSGGTEMTEMGLKAMDEQARRRNP